MPVIIAAVATDSGVPIFCRKRGAIDNVQFSTIASLHGINMFSKCHNTTMVNTQVDNGTVLWKEYKSITLIAMVTGGLETHLQRLLEYVYNVIILFIGRQELDAMKNIEQMKRDLRQCYIIIDYLLEALDANTISATHPTAFVDLIECVLCPQAQQLQMALDNYADQVTGRWACLSIHGRLVSTSSDFSELSSLEAKLLMLLLTSQDGAPLRETLVYLPEMSPNVAFRAVTCKLLGDVYILVICSATPTLSQIDEIVLRCWENCAHLIKEAKLLFPRNFPLSVSFEPCILGILLINLSNNKCVISRHLHQSQHQTKAMSASHRLDILRNFYVIAASTLIPYKTNEATCDNDLKEYEEDDSIQETYWSSEYHKCHAQKSDTLMCCVLYASNIPTHTMRLITNQLIEHFENNKEILW